MKTLLLACAAIVLVTSAQTIRAADVAAPNTTVDMSDSGKIKKAFSKEHHPWTLDDARRHAHEYADKLDKMTPQEWADMQKRRQGLIRKWAGMTPEERNSYIKTRGSKGQAAGQ